jgi:hypothetical protein
MLGRMMMFGPTQLLNFMVDRPNQPRLPVQQLGLLQLSSLARDMVHKGSTGAAMLRPTVIRLLFVRFYVSHFVSLSFYIDI